MKRMLTGLFAALVAELSAFTPFDGYRCQFVRELEAGHAQKIVCYGTSLTYGHYVMNPPKFFQEALDARYPGLATVVNCGSGGKSSIWGARSENLQTVINNSPDVVFIEFATNDAVLDATYDSATETWITSEKEGISCSLAASRATSSRS